MNFVPTDGWIPSSLVWLISSKKWMINKAESIEGGDFNDQGKTHYVPFFQGK